MHMRFTSEDGILNRRFLTDTEERGEGMIDEGRARMGIVTSWFNGDGGYGFIHPNEVGEAVFVHHTSIAPHATAKSLKKGARVTYEVTREKMAGLWARNVCI
jgi:CspA family cold shock protein